ncbi:bifunctional precorrin-2 dehydrogenase/sirohydrochlorin ferrochelatase [Clostridium sp. AM58-1XD]|uniref:precorrin-2 dehydrogenase/sirohydrochlorin ferrochelatase family protein n=1 Tax=Clostridium sp. AM58-1XD TaxID=2292307 RepID=UPI0015F5457B|nr:bifunctional precorrin-2 dehydrogenase/sirohydrochlorin ferrochelatase [Clostridium sp. AM58-1XD]
MEEQKNSYFPLFVDMSGKTVLFVGGGRVVQRRIEAFMSVVNVSSEKQERQSGGLQIIVAAPEVTEQIDKYVRDGYIWWKRKPFSEDDVDGADYVIAATNDMDVNQRISELCRQRGIPVNDAGKKENCDFYFPGIAVKGDLVAGITASGNSHSLTKQVTEAVRELFYRLK